MFSKPPDAATPISCSYDGLTFNPRIAIAILFYTICYSKIKYYSLLVEYNEQVITAACE